MALKTRPWDASEFLADEEDIADYLAVALDDGDAVLVNRALANVARALGMTAMANAAGVSRAVLYEDLRDDDGPRLSTLMGVLKAFGLRVHVTAADAHQGEPLPLESYAADPSASEIVLPADPNDPEDGDVSAEGMDRAGHAFLVRTTRTQLGLSQAEFAARFRVPVGTLRYWEQARATPPDFASAYLKIIRANPDLVAEIVASGKENEPGSRVEKNARTPRKRE